MLFLTDGMLNGVERRQWPTKRLTTEAIDGGLGISFPSFEPDDFAQSLRLLMAGSCRPQPITNQGAWLELPSDRLNDIPRADVRP